jgi:transcriptional regulator with XRE-family HTH domain
LRALLYQQLQKTRTGLMNLGTAIPRKRQTRRHPVDRQIGQRIRAFRMAQQMSQAELGRRLGVTFQQIQNYEKGSSRIGGSRLKELAAALDVSLLALFGTSGEAGEKKMDAFLIERMSHRYSARILNAFFAIPTKREQRAIVAMLEAMASKSRAKRRARRTGGRGAKVP